MDSATLAAVAAVLGSATTAAGGYLRDRLKYGASDRRNLTEQVALLFTHVATLNAEITSLRGEVRERDIKIDILQEDQLRSLQSERDTLQHELTETREEAAELKAEVAALRAQVEGV